MKITKSHIEARRDSFTEKSKAVPAVEHIVDLYHKDPPRDFWELLNAETWYQIVRSTFKHNMKMNVENIFDHAESEIESLFFNSLNIAAFLNVPYLLVFTPPLESPSDTDLLYQQIESTISLHHNEFIKETGKTDITEFLDFVNKADSFDNDLRFFLQFFTILYRIFPFKHAYHLSMQSSFKDVKIDNKYIRPDAYVWVPSNPDFRLIIECDGFRYHSDKESFTKDRARDRVLQRKGFIVLRFSGHEIYHDPVGKALELLDYFLENTDLSLFEGKD
ncbi:MAG: DUF559 domain-containing protein [Deltaproteobacteria bacterium]|nr:DUF559 domain-containing protein [Deltaproteobacteria bacterium]